MTRWLIAVLSLLLPVNVLAGSIPGLTSKKLPNGLEVIVVENHAVPLVTIEVAVRSGGFVETPEYSGLSHLYEHMFFKGNKVLPNQEKYLKRLREMGADWNGTTGTERVNYFFTLPAENLREGTAFMRDALLTPLFDQKELERERIVVLGELDRAEGRPGFHLFREVDRKLWTQYFSRKNVLGDRDMLASTTREKMTTIRDRYYVPNNSALLFAGDVKPEQAFALAEEYFGDWKATEDPHKLYPVPAHPPLTKSSTIAVIQPVNTVTLRKAWHGPGMTADVPATFAADVFSFIIGQPTSRFHKKLIDSGLFDNIGLTYFSQVYTGPISADGVTSAERFDRALAALNDEIGHMADDDYFTDEEMQFAKNQLEVSELYGRERTSNFVHTVSFWWATGGLDYYEDYIDNLRKVTRADIQRYLRRYVLGKPNVTGVLLSEADLARLQSLKTAEVVKPQTGSSATAMAAAATEGVKTEAFDADGIRVVLRSNPQSEVVAARAFLLGGVAYSGRDRAGLEPLMLEVAAKATRKYPKEKMARELTRLGATLNSEGSVDDSTFTLVSLRRNFAESMDIFLDALVHPVFSEEEVALARERKLTALAREEEDPDAYLDRLAIENAYGTHPLAINPAGTRDRIAAVKATDLQKLHRDTMNRSRLLLVVVGNVTKDEVTKLVRNAVSDLPRGEFRKADVLPIPASDRVTTRVVQRDLPTVYVQGLFPGANLSAPDFPALHVGMRILANRFFEELRTKRNLSYAPGAWTFERSASVGAVYITTPKPNEALPVMAEEIRKMQSAPLSDEEVRNTANTVRTGLLQNMQASADVADWLGRFETRGGGWQKLDEFLAALAGVTPAEVQQAMNKYAHNIDFAVLGKLEGMDQKLLTSF